MNLKKIGETSYKETAFGIIPRSKLISLEIEGIKRAWDYVLYKNSNDIISITPEFIKEVHKIGFGWIFPEMGGKFRKIDVQVSNYIPPKFYLISQFISNFTKDLEIRIKHIPKIEEDTFLNELIDLLAWAHHRFLWIHPFQDYNGRIGRLLINIILLSLDLPPMELKIETIVNRRKYVESLKLADNNNYEKLKKLIRSAIEESIKEIDLNS